MKRALKIRSPLWVHVRVISALLALFVVSATRAMQQDASLLSFLVEKPKPIPERWSGLIGEYASDTDSVYLLEKDGQLQCATNLLVYYPLEEQQQDVFEFSYTKMNGASTVAFERNEQGRAAGFWVGKKRYNRLHIDREDGVTFTIRPLKSIDLLKKEALAARPPQEEGTFSKSDLVDVAVLDSTVKLDIRYATTNNFMQTAFYAEAKAFLQRPAAEALVRAHRALQRLGFGVLIYDAYRPWYVTKMFWDATPNDKKIFVADPSKGSRHNRGCAVDLTLYDLTTGKPVEMVSGYDEFSDRAFPDYGGGTSLQRWHRSLLRKAMEAEGFSVYEFEWWHFDYHDWQQYPIGTMTFEEIK